MSRKPTNLSAFTETIKINTGWLPQPLKEGYPLFTHKDGYAEIYSNGSGLFTLVFRDSDSEWDQRGFTTIDFAKEYYYELKLKSTP